METTIPQPQPGPGPQRFEPTYKEWKRLRRISINLNWTVFWAYLQGMETIGEDLKDWRR